MKGHKYFICDMIPYNYSPLAYGSLHIIALCIRQMELFLKYVSVALAPYICDLWHDAATLP